MLKSTKKEFLVGVGVTLLVGYWLLAPPKQGKKPEKQPAVPPVRLQKQVTAQPVLDRRLDFEESEWSSRFAPFSTVGAAIEAARTEAIRHSDFLSSQRREFNEETSPALLLAALNEAETDANQHRDFVEYALGSIQKTLSAKLA